VLTAIAMEMLLGGLAQYLGNLPRYA